jgi:hypothetical protein
MCFGEAGDEYLWSKLLFLNALARKADLVGRLVQALV